MSHYISRDDGKIAAWEILNGMGISQKHNEKLVDEVEAVFDDIPACDVAYVRRGKWMRTNCSPHRIYCSECYGTFIPDDEVTRLKDVPHRFCPKCGASMEERK